MIIIGTLLVALLVISDGATVRNDLVISDCNCDDNSEVFDSFCTRHNLASPMHDYKGYTPIEKRTEKNLMLRRVFNQQILSLDELFNGLFADHVTLYRRLMSQHGPYVYPFLLYIYFMIV